MNKYLVICPTCKKERYVSYTQRSSINRGLKGGQCRECYKSDVLPLIPLSVRLEKKLKRLDNGCLVWTGHIMPNGYARIGLGRKGEGAVYIHRAAYELKNGKIPEGLQIDHLCSNRACANPEHLEAVTNRENTIRGKVPKLSYEKADKIRDMYKNGNYSPSKLSELYGVTVSNIYRVIQNKHWVS